MAKRFALIIESHNVVGQDLIPGAKRDADNWCAFLKSNLGGAWRSDEIIRLSKPTSIAIRIQLILHEDCYVFLAFSGHGFTERKPSSTELITKVCLNEKEQAVPINEISPKRLGTAVFDCCRGLENSQGNIKIANESFSATGGTTPLHGTTDAVWQLVTNSAQPRSQAQEVISKEFARQIEILQRFATVQMFSCNKNESAGEDPNAGGYYTTLLMQGARDWAERQKANRYYAVYNTKQAHDFAAEAMKEVNPKQHPEYTPVWQSYPFAIG